MSSLPRLVCATANPGKVAEIAALLVGLVDLQPRPAGLPDVIEDADDLEGNARLKAAAVCAATGAAAVSDDTGLFVEALGGRPGVHTARFAGEPPDDAANRVALLAALEGVADRRAHFATIAMVVRPDGSELVVEGRCYGTIATAQRGERGFGYDALFVPDDGDGRTFAQMSHEEKNLVSHRAKAFAALVDALSAE
ncbi:MAG: nucleoside-triphosphatase [Ilumatobacteraceae bacterium]|nr:nucleoside-triphosphatase [Ilumatobacteraceae bacterium]